MLNEKRIKALIIISLLLIESFVWVINGPKNFWSLGFFGGDGGHTSVEQPGDNPAGGGTPEEPAQNNGGQQPGQNNGDPAGSKRRTARRQSGQGACITAGWGCGAADPGQ